MSVIDLISSGSGHVSPLIVAATALAIVLGALTRLIKALQPMFQEAQKTRRTTRTERERTVRQSQVITDGQSLFIITGRPAGVDPDSPDGTRGRASK